MKKNLPKVLMLGWEFPPFINGGLGIACHDLSVAMSEWAEITMLVPRSSPDFIMENINLVGLNNVDIPSIVGQYNLNFSDYPFTIHSIPSDLNPYYRESSFCSQPGGNLFLNDFSKRQSFNIDNLYGDDILNKVVQYANISSALASTLNFDVIHAHDWMTMLAGVKIKQQTGKPLIMHIHSLEVDRSGFENKGWVYELEKKGMEYADLLVPVSNYTAENIKKYYGISKSKINVVHNGSNSVKVFKNKKKFNEKMVLFVGRITRQKGPEKFLDIASKVLDGNPDVRFVMAGVGDNFKSVIEKSSSENIGNRFHMTGFLNSQRLRYLFSISDVYCMPSLSEPFGLSAVEAAQFGVPCVISKQSGVAEVLSGALKFDFWDVNKAADCILSLLNDSVLREKVIHDVSLDLDKISWRISSNKIRNAYTINKFIN